MGEVAIAASPHGSDHIRLFFAMSNVKFRFLFASYGRPFWKPRDLLRLTTGGATAILQWQLLRAIVSEVGILILDDDIASQRALKLVLDAEGWRVRIVSHPSEAMTELASGTWDLAIVNVALLDMQGPFFVTLQELAQADTAPPTGHRTPPGADASPAAVRFRVLFLVPLMGSKEVPLLLEREGLPYSFKPYHLHDFLQKVSELLLESGAIGEPLRSVEGFGRKKRHSARHSRDARGQKMFASREDYQMTEEEMAEFERQEKEEAERKKRDKQLSNREPF
jgi:hypothetical protein